MKVKKLLAMVLALTLVLGLLPGTAWAADEDDGFTTVNTEEELIKELDKGTEKIKLGKDISSKSGLNLHQEVIIDLDGHTWTAPEDFSSLIGVEKGGNATLQNGTASFSVAIYGGKLTMAGVKLGGMINCNDGELVSMEDCVISGGNGSDYPQGINVREDGSVGTIKNCTIELTGNKAPMPLVIVGGSVDTIEGCTISATSKGTEEFFYPVQISKGGSVGTIKDCTITANGKNYCAGIDIENGASVKSIEGCTITAKNTGDNGNAHGIAAYGELGTVKDCKITAPCAIDSYGDIDEISGCTLDSEYSCIVNGEGTIGSVLSNVMTATGTYGKGMEILGSVGTIAYNVHEVTFAFIQLHEAGKVKTVSGNAGNAGISTEGEIGTISGNSLWLIYNEGTISLLGNNVIGRSDGIIDEGTIKKTDDSSPADSLDKGKWYYEAMAYAYDENLAFGIPDGKFNPDDKLTRATLTQMLWNLEEWPMPDSGSFTDVASDAWYRNSVNWAASEEIVNGYGGGLFKPEDSITREQVATILYRYVKGNGGDVSGKANLSGYTDSSKISAYALEAMQWANNEGLITGTSDTTLSPQGNTTCAQMATILMRLMGE